MTIKITPKIFSGTSKVFDGTLAAAMISLAQTQAALVASTITGLTDNSGGAVGTEIINPGLPADFTATTGNGVAKTEFEASLVSIRLNMRALISQINDISAKVPALPQIDDNLGGSAPADNTLVAFDTTMTGTDAGPGLVSAVGARTVLGAFAGRISQITGWVNALAAATGVEPLGDRIAGVEGVTKFTGTAVTTLSTDTGTAVTGSGTVSKVSADTILGSYAANLATLAAKLNQITSTTPTLGVVAA